MVNDILELARFGRVSVKSDFRKSLWVPKLRSHVNKTVATAKLEESRPGRDPAAELEDALAQTGAAVLFFPPFCLQRRILTKATEERWTVLGDLLK